MGARNHNQAAVLPVDSLHGRPGTDDAVGRSEGEVMQVLVHGVSRGQLACTYTNCENNAKYAHTQIVKTMPSMHAIIMFCLLIQI